MLRIAEVQKVHDISILSTAIMAMTYSTIIPPQKHTKTDTPFISIHYMFGYPVIYTMTFIICLAIQYYNVLYTMNIS